MLDSRAPLGSDGETQSQRLHRGTLLGADDGFQGSSGEQMGDSGALWWVDGRFQGSSGRLAGWSANQLAAPDSQNRLNLRDM